MTMVPGWRLSALGRGAPLTHHAVTVGTPSRLPMYCMFAEREAFCCSEEFLGRVAHPSMPAATSLPGWNHDSIPCAPRHPPRVKLPSLAMMPPQQQGGKAPPINVGMSGHGAPQVAQQSKSSQLESWITSKAAHSQASARAFDDFGASWSARQGGASSARGSSSARQAPRPRGRMQPMSARGEEPLPPRLARAAVVAAPAIEIQQQQRQPPPTGCGGAQGGGVSAALAPPSTRTAGTAAGADTADTAAAPSAAPADAHLHIDLHAAAREAGFLQLATPRPPAVRPKPKFGAGGAMKMDADQLLEAKEAELDKWLRKFVKKNGLQELYDSKPDAQYESVLLKEDIGLNAAEVQGVVRQERESYRVRARHASSMRRGMAGIEDKAMHVSTYAGRSGTTRANREAQLEKHCEAVGSSFSAALASEYAAAKLEGQREFQVSEINSQREALRSRFGEDVEVDLAKALLDPQAGGFSGGAFGDTLAGGDSEAAGLATRKAIETMEGVSERFAAEVGMSPLQAKLRKAMRSGGGSGGGIGIGGGSAGGMGGLPPMPDLPALDEDSEDDGSALSPLRPQRKSTPRSPAISARALHSGLAHLPRTPEGAPPVPGLWPRPRSRALDPGGGVPFGVPMAPRSPHTPLSPPPAGMLQQQQQVSAGLGPPSTPLGSPSKALGYGLGSPSQCASAAAAAAAAAAASAAAASTAVGSVPSAAASACGLDALIGGVRTPGGRAAAAAAAAAGLKLQPAGQYDRLVLEQSDDGGRIQQEQGGGGGGFPATVTFASDAASPVRAATPYRCSLRRASTSAGSDVGGRVAAGGSDSMQASPSRSPEKGKAANSSSPRPFPPPPTLEPVTVFASNSPFLQRRPGG